MSPIFVRPVREQLEHDRLIRHLQAHYRKKNNEVAINPGEDQSTSVKLGPFVLYPDIVVSEAGRLTGLVEVESGESVNNLEAMAQWAHFGKARVPFHLYVPVQFYDAAKRLADARGVRITEIWTYRGLLDGFDLVRMHHDPAAGVPKAGVPGVKVMGKPAPIPVAPVEAVAPPEPVIPPPAAHTKIPTGKPAAAQAVPVARHAPASAKPVPPARPQAVVAPKAPAKPVKAAPAKAAPAKAVKVVAKAAKSAKPSKVPKPVKPAPRPAAKAPSKAQKAKATATAKPAAKRPKPSPKGAKKAARRK